MDATIHLLESSIYQSTVVNLGSSTETAKRLHPQHQNMTNSPTDTKTKPPHWAVQSYSRSRWLTADTAQHWAPEPGCFKIRPTHNSQHSKPALMSVWRHHLATCLLRKMNSFGPTLVSLWAAGLMLIHSSSCFYSISWKYPRPLWNVDSFSQ